MSFSVKKMSPQDQAVSMTHDEALKIIERAKTDKFLAQELEHLREKCCSFVSDIMHEANQALAEKNKRTPALLRSKECDAMSLRGAAREREAVAKQRRELAEAMVIGALFNSGNPDWNPLDPATHQSGRSNLLLALLKTARD